MNEDEPKQPEGVVPEATPEVKSEPAPTPPVMDTVTFTKAQLKERLDKLTVRFDEINNDFAKKKKEFDEYAKNVETTMIRMQGEFQTVTAMMNGKV